MITVIIVLAIIGVLVYLLEQLPMAQPFKVAIRVIAILFVVLYLVQMFGLDLHVPRFR